MSSRISVRVLTPADEPEAERLLDAELGGRHQARLGEVHDVLALDGIVAEVDGQLAGVAVYRVDGDRAELAAITVAGPHRRGGAGEALLEEVCAAIKEGGARELWLVTTNDNLDALRFYQRRGFVLAELHAGGVDRARATLKPSIPELGLHGIPMRDELVLTRQL